MNTIIKSDNDFIFLSHKNLSINSQVAIILTARMSKSSYMYEN